MEVHLYRIKVIMRVQVERFYYPVCAMNLQPHIPLSTVIVNNKRGLYCLADRAAQASGVVRSVKALVSKNYTILCMGGKK